MTLTAVTPELDGLKTRLKTTWMAGDYDQFSRYMENSTREFYEHLNLHPGCEMLDVACGSGGLALLAARDGINATGVDIAANSIARATARARALGLSARFIEADAEALPFAESSFDFVTSLIGAMFAPRPDAVARELLRVCSPGGTIAMANWTAQGFVGQMFKLISRFIAPAGMPAPVLWGDEATVRDRLAAGVSDLSLTRRNFYFDYPFSPADVLEFFRLYYGPTQRAFSTLPEDEQNALRMELEAHWSSHNLAGGQLTVVAAEYLEVIAVRS
jgi:SAM-dependent methyltransferase